MSKLDKLNAWADESKFHAPKSAQGYLRSRAEKTQGKARKGKKAGAGACGVACSPGEE